jgi:hypothetical protein
LYDAVVACHDDERFLSFTRSLNIEAFPFVGLVLLCVLNHMMFVFPIFFYIFSIITTASRNRFPQPVFEYHRLYDNVPAFFDRGRCQVPGQQEKIVDLALFSVF